jgi:hypothetical protein
VPLPKQQGIGRRRAYCRQSHRQRAYEARRAAERRGIGIDEVLVSRHVWESLRDALYRLQAAAEDVATDTSGARATKADYVEAVAHLSHAVRELQEISVEPVALLDG